MLPHGGQAPVAGVVESGAELRVFPTVLAHSLLVVDGVLDVGDAVAQLHGDSHPVLRNLRISELLALVAILAGLVSDAPGDRYGSLREARRKKVFQGLRRVFGDIVRPAGQSDDATALEAETNCHTFGFTEVISIRKDAVLGLGTMRSRAPFTGSAEGDGAIGDKLFHGFLPFGLRRQAKAAERIRLPPLNRVVDVIRTRAERPRKKRARQCHRQAQM